MSAELDSKHVADLAVHVRALSDELATERRARTAEAEKGISILRLHVPLLLWFLSFGSGVGATLFVMSTRDHITDAVIHVDARKSLQLGGIVYRKDMDDAIETKVSDLEAADRRLGRVISKGTGCPVDRKHGTALCAFPDPSTLPLR